jgi:hypothetical protein
MAADNPMNNLNAILAGKFGEGWDGLESEPSPQATYEANLARYQGALDIAAPFRNTEGRKALEALRNLTTRKPTFDAEGREFYSAAAYGFAREGQNSIIRHIERCLDMVDQGPPIQPTQQKET